MRNYQVDMDKLAKKVVQVVDEMILISNEYAKWNEWDKADIVSKSANILKEHYQKELLESEGLL